MSEANKTRFAVVGLGHFAQAAILPAFERAREKAELAALVTGDQEKAAKLSKKYQVPAVSYEDYDGLLSSGKIDAVYIATPNSEHRKFTEQAAGAGVHVLCEKPLAFLSADAEAMIDACRSGNVKLMTAYRLHFERETSRQSSMCATVKSARRDSSTPFTRCRSILITFVLTCRSVAGRLKT